MFEQLLGCCGLPFGALIVALVGATLLRGAVAAANRVLGPAPPPDTFGQWDDWDSDEPAPVARPRDTRKVPEPTLITGGMVTFVAGFVSGVVLAVLWALFDADPADSPDEPAAVALLLLFGLPASALVHAVLLVPLLPTTFTRAALVALFHHLLGVAILAVLGGAGLLMWYATGP
jgi:hypothetical protein